MLHDRGRVAQCKTVAVHAPTVSVGQVHVYRGVVCMHSFIADDTLIWVQAAYWYNCVRNVEAVMDTRTKQSDTRADTSTAYQSVSGASI